MKKIGFALCQAICITLLIISLFGSTMLLPLSQHLNDSGQRTKSTANWTYMVYLDADNNLDSYGVDDLNEMEDGYDSAVSSSINVIAFIDRYSSGATTYKIVEDHNTGSIASTIQSTSFPSEPNMGAKSTLKSFISYCFNNFPANNYVLDLWDHGGGVFGICWDDSSDEDRLSFDEVDEAISDACSVAGEKIDILAMDACLMQMLEVNYELRDYVNYIVASEETIPGYGYPYEEMIDALCSNPTPYNYADDMIDLYHNSYSSSYDTTLSAVDVDSAKFDPLMQAFYEFLDATINIADRSTLQAARAATQEFYYEEFVDLKDFCDEVASRTSGEVKTAAETLATNISNAVINTKQHNNPQAYGISIYFPEDEGDYDSGYETIIDLGQETDWPQFLDYFYHGPTFSLGLTNYLVTAGDGDGVAEQNETSNLSITIKNTGTEDAYSVNGTLSSLDANVTINTISPQNYGNMADGDFLARDFQFFVNESAPTNSLIELTFTINATFYTPTGLNYIRDYTLFLIINVSIIMGGGSFETAVSIDHLMVNSMALFYSLLPGPDVQDFGSWFKINLADTSKYLITGIVNAPDYTDFDIYIYTPSGTLITFAVAGWYPDYTSTLLPTTGAYRVKLVPYNGTGVFRLNITESDYPGPEDGYSFGTAHTLTENTSYPVTATAPTPTKSGYRFYRVYLDKNERIKVTLDGDSSSHDFDVYVIDMSFEVVAYTTASSYPESCDYSADDESYYYIVIVPYSGSGEFELTVEFRGPFKMPTWLIIIIIVVIIVAVIVALFIFFKLSR